MWVEAAPGRGVGSWCSLPPCLSALLSIGTTADVGQPGADIPNWPAGPGWSLGAWSRG